MTRKKWTTKEQEDWLAERLPSFVQAQKDKTSSGFFPPIYDDFNKRWPCPTPTQEEIAAAGGDRAKAEAILLKKYNKVRILYFKQEDLTHSTYNRVFTGGILIIHVPRHLEQI